MNGNVRWDRIAAGFAVAALVVSLFVSYIRTTATINESLNRNCRLLVRIEAEQQFLILRNVHDQQGADDFRAAVANLPNEICG